MFIARVEEDRVELGESRTHVNTGIDLDSGAPSPLLPPLTARVL